MKSTYSAIFVAAALSASAFAHGGLPTQKMITIEVAQTIAQEAMKTCRADVTKSP